MREKQENKEISINKENIFHKKKKSLSSKVITMIFASKLQSDR